MLAVVKRAIKGIVGVRGKVTVKLIYRCDSCGSIHTETKVFDVPMSHGKAYKLAGLKRLVECGGADWGNVTSSDAWVVVFGCGTAEFTCTTAPIDRVIAHKCSDAKIGFAQLQSVEDILNDEELVNAV